MPNHSNNKICWIHLSSAQLNWTKLNSTKLIWTELTWTNLNWTELNWTELNWTDLNWTDLTWSDLDRTELNWTDSYLYSSWLFSYSVINFDPFSSSILLSHFIPNSYFFLVGCWKWTSGDRKIWNDVCENKVRVEGLDRSWEKNNPSNRWRACLLLEGRGGERNNGTLHDDNCSAVMMTGREIITAVKVVFATPTMI